MGDKLISFLTIFFAAIFLLLLASFYITVVTGFFVLSKYKSNKKIFKDIKFEGNLMLNRFFQLCHILSYFLSPILIMILTNRFYGIVISIIFVLIVIGIIDVFIINKNVNQIKEIFCCLILPTFVEFKKRKYTLLLSPLTDNLIQKIIGVYILIIVIALIGNAITSLQF